MYITNSVSGEPMNSFNPDARLSNLWKAFYNMPSKTTITDRIVENEKSAQKSKLQSDIAQATSREYIQSKKVEGTFFVRLENDKKKQTENNMQTINEIRYPCLC